MPLTANQEIFCQEYKKDRNGARAYRDAYPECKSGHDVCACKLLRIAKIKERIAEIMAEIVAEIDITREMLVKEAMAIAQDPNATKTEKTRALSLVADMIGAKREAAPNKEKEQALAARMTKEERELAVLAARLRTEQEARKGIKLAGVG
jgi:hypothetical protein